MSKIDPEILITIKYIDLKQSNFSKMTSKYKYHSKTNTNSNIISALESGVGVVNYRGWGDATGWHKPDFHLDDIEEE